MVGSGYFDPKFGNWLPDDDPLPVGECSKCGCDLYEGEHVYLLDDEVFCSLDCVIDSLQIKYVEMERGM